VLRCGLRISETASLRLTDLYLDESPPRLLIRGKGNRERAARFASRRKPSRLCVSTDTHVYSDGEWLVLNELGLQPDGLISLPEAEFTHQAFGPVHVIAWWDKNYNDPLYLVTNLPLAEEACHWYKRRY
jgi:hypothetical protein